MTRFAPSFPAPLQLLRSTQMQIRFSNAELYEALCPHEAELAQGGAWGRFLLALLGDAAVLEAGVAVSVSKGWQVE